MGNVTLPTPVFLAGGALCLLAGVMVGSVLGPGTPERTTAEVASFDREGSRLCLEGEAIGEQEGVDDEGLLCGTWRRTPGSRLPQEGDTFRFVSVSTSGELDGRDETQVVIYGDVAD
ncbi:MAG TPA: hypothetical protein VFJ28_10725 [Marmoricola sp.]|nr:hypothetical protein [Marmoricola sp.]